ncbi:putative nucleic acid-binding, replication factor A [Helianthus annuus]|uniref:Nucleic acid-binding, replication factor A n=2 Tax=Helianthus annuus TaxID=4232 RepID=A0A9K3IW37_HELAN|nr:replication protein A 70 kDa DNA-binding subunit E isoform X1 [Helianthus annuus]XP_021970553.1 replication protein A 70 kDa DNA-binding subunit E isoform X1 [Helianthus annuus]XP_021970554.1 replication protein A 70 kDa DNA-binding subunit E isoform X2 [Helianthus annuus]XP_035829898.1 replication protein A 70 kDa DNA-binding subunit E isoform X2 [Helianthus annuus]KAF5803716.1 putative nucleic acid-binding, replication factor A [Helianthus annuus]KAJ0561628.1 putative nucleic acid-binding
MEGKNIIYLNDIDGKTRAFTIKVKVVRLWKRSNPKKAGETWAIDMVLMDEKGTKMQATVWSNDFKKHEKILQQNECYTVFKPRFDKNNQKFKHFDTKYVLTFNLETTIRKCNNFIGPTHGFEFSTFKSIKNGGVSSEFRTDFIGYVEEWFAREDTTTRYGKQSYKMDLILRDLEGIALKLTLWEEYCDQMQEYISKNKEEEHIVLIVQFGSVHDYKGTINVANAYYITKLFINERNEEIVNFKRSYIGKASVTTSTHRSIGQSGVTSNEDEFLHNTTFSTIRQIREIAQVMHVIVVGTVMAVDKDSEWYYLGCESCNCKASPSLQFPEDDNGSDDVDPKEVLVCTNKKCKRDVVPAVHMYKVSIQVEDCTGIVNLTLFDRDTVKLWGLSAKQLVDKYLQVSDDEKTIPAEFNAFINKKYAFKIHVKKYNVDNKVDGFSINKLVDDPAIIAKLEKKFDVVPFEEFDSMILPTTVSSSQSDAGVKDSKSYAVDDSTPLPKNYESRKSPCDLKRTLEDSNDLDNSYSVSSTKSRKIETKEDIKAQMKDKLLIPKLEK